MRIDCANSPANTNEGLCYVIVGSINGSAWSNVSEGDHGIVAIPRGRDMLRTFWFCFVLAAVSPPVVAQENSKGPGDYGYRHEEYHHRGIVDELERKAGQSCCDKKGECRATYVDMAQRRAFVEGRWCPMEQQTSIHTDIALPDRFALVCAGRPASPYNPCPTIYCVALAPGS